MNLEKKNFNKSLNHIMKFKILLITLILGSTNALAQTTEDIDIRSATTSNLQSDSIGFSIASYPMKHSIVVTYNATIFLNWILNHGQEYNRKSGFLNPKAETLKELASKDAPNLKLSESSCERTTELMKKRKANASLNP